MNWTEQDLRDEFRAQEDRGPSALAVSARLDGAPSRRRRTRTGWIAVVAVGVVTSAIPLLVAGRASAPPRHGPSNAVSSRDPAYGLSTAVPPTSCNVSALAVPGGQDVSSATAIDPSGQYILLEAAESNAGFLDSSPPVDTRRTSLWVHGKLRPMDVPGHATDVNASGVVVGSGRTGPWILRNGHVSTLPGVADGNATAINSTNAVAGTRLLSASSTTRPVVWRTPGAEAIDLPVSPDVFSSAASDIDDDGTVVGDIDMGTPNGKASHAHVWFPDATERDLQVPPGSGLINPVAWSIRNGWVAGAADTRRSARSRPWWWACVGTCAPATYGSSHPSVEERSTGRVGPSAAPPNTGCSSPTRARSSYPILAHPMRGRTPSMDSATMAG